MSRGVAAIFTARTPVVAKPTKGARSANEWEENTMPWAESVFREAIRRCYWRPAFGEYGAPRHIYFDDSISSEDGEFSHGMKGPSSLAPFSTPRDGVSLRMTAR